MTHTYAVLEVSPMAFAEIQQRLKKAEYEADGPEIDMHGIAIKALTGGPGSIDLQIGTLLSHRTKKGVVELAVNGERTQMDVAKAREVVDMLHQAIEAAISDEIIYNFLQFKVGLSEHAASAALLDFRELRQGSRTTVYPS